MIMGGGYAGSREKDVWLSRNDGVTWTVATSSAPWEGK